jgi:drug/metabolite transporter (DMT)-like permease
MGKTSCAIQEECHPRKRGSQMFPSQQLFAASLVLAAMLLLTLNRTAVKFSTADLHAVQITFLMYAVGSILSFGALHLRSATHRTPLTLSEMVSNYRTGLLRGVSGALSGLLLVLALQTLPLGVVSALFYVKVFFALVLGVLIFRENVGLLRWSVAFVAVTGVSIVAYSGGSFPLAGLLFVILAAFASAVLQVLLRNAARSQSPIIVCFQLSFVCSAVLLIPAMVVWRPVSYDALAFVAVSGIASFLSQLLLACAYSRADISVLAPIDTSQIAFALFAGFFFFDEQLTFRTLAGLLLIWGAIFAGSFITQKITTPKLAGAAHEPPPSTPSSDGETHVRHHNSPIAGRS